MKRRTFLQSIPLSALAAHSLHTMVSADDLKEDKPTSLVDSPPILQNPSEDGMTVTWAVKGFATGYVEYGETPDLGRKAVTNRFGWNPYDDRFLQARILGLKPGTTCYYRTVTVPVDFQNAYKVVSGELVLSEIRSFQTPDENQSTASFSVINDTHQKTPTLHKLTAKLGQIQADYTIWNGDLINDYYTDEQVIENIARPANAPFAAEKPLLFVRGNHDYRGPWARNLPRLLTPWSHADAQYANLPYNFAFRQGPLALIGLDTGEDKPDNHPVFGGLIQCEPGKQLQAQWLAETLKRPDIASAPYIVAFCHIPLEDPRPNANDGTTLEGYASYSGSCQKLWGPILHKAGVQLVIAGHQHRYRYSEPVEARGWAQIVGGGPGGSEVDSPGAATLIHGVADKEGLAITVHNIESEKILGTFRFQPRS